MKGHDDQDLLELGGGRGGAEAQIPGKGMLSPEPKGSFFLINMKSVIPSRMSVLIICILITGLGVISVTSHLSKRRRSQRNRRGVGPLGVGIRGNERGHRTAFT